MRLIDAERLREELLWRNVFLTDNEIDALVDLIDNQPTIFPLNDPLTLDELRAMVGNPVYDCFGQVWYIVESYYDHDLIMTDGTHFNDENKYAKVSKRFYCNRPIKQFAENGSICPLWEEKTMGIKPCPFCDCEITSTDEISEGAWTVICKVCGAYGPSAETEELAVAYWNARGGESNGD